MSLITRQDSNGVKPLLQTGELGYDNYPAGGDKGRVYVGTGSENIPLAKKAEMSAVDSKADLHIARADNPHGVTKAQVGLGNVDNTSDLDKPISMTTQAQLDTKALKITSVSAGTGLEGGGDLSASRTLSVKYGTVAGTALQGSALVTIAGQSDTVTMSQKAVTNYVDAEVTAHKNDKNNPHNVTKSQVGLSNVDNTSDANKPISTATQNALNTKANISYVDALPGVGAKGNQDTTGNADTASKLQTARTIGGVSFDGTVDINLPGVNIAGTQSTTGNAGSASKLATARTINGVAFDGTANITIADSTAVKLTGNETIAGTKTFSSTIVGSINGNSATVTNGVYTAGNQTIGGVKTFSSFPVTPSSSPTADYQTANKKYVDNAIEELVNGGSTGAYGVRYDQNNNIVTELGNGNRTQIQDRMRRCVLNSDGTVNYYLNQYDSTKKENNTASVLDGTDGNVMVQVPKFWYKHKLVNDVHEWWVSPVAKEGYSVHPWFLEGGVEHPFRYYRAYTCIVQSNVLRSVSGVTPTRSQTIGVFRTQARANGAGWNLCSWNAVNAIQLLYLTEYCNFNSQAVLGTGNYLGNDYGMTTGASNVIGNASTKASVGDTYMSYRGIENFYADCLEFVDGINVQNYKVFLSQNPATFADNVFTGDYVDSGITVPPASNSFVEKISGNFLPTALGGDSNTFITDAFWSATGNRIAFFGGALNGASVGAFCLRVSSVASGSGVDIGAGLSR